MSLSGFRRRCSTPTTRSRPASRRYSYSELPATSDFYALLAGNGILLEYDVARFVADSEAIYSYEGTREINSLIVGLAITGESAFVGK